MEDYKPNSFKYREKQKQDTENQKNVQKVVRGPVKLKKKSGLQNFKDSMVAEDFSKVKSFVRDDVLIPSLKKAISDIIKNGIDIFLYGEPGHSKSSSGIAASKVSYRSYYNSSNNNSGAKPASRSTYSYDDIVLSDRGDAEHVLTQMVEIIDTYGMVSVADLYDLLGQTGSYTDNNYGWTDLHSACTVRVADGYLLKLPRVISLK